MKNILMRPMLYRDILMLLSETEPGQEERHLRTAKTRLKHGPAYAFLDGETIFACAGVTIYWPGMGEVWLVTSQAWPRYLREIVVWTRKVLDQLQDENNLTRIQADVVSDNAAACRFVEHFGFVAEGILRKYDVLGRDCIRYARIKEGEGL